MSRVHQRFRLLLAVVFVMFAGLAACSAVPQENGPPIESSLPDLAVAGPMDDMMQYYDSVHRRSPAELGRAYDKAKQNFAKNKSEANRARLVLLLTLPNTSFRDVNSALQLLSEWQRVPGATTDLQSFRNLMVNLLTEQQKLSQSVEDLAQKLKEEQKRVDTLQSQIDAIKNMEKTLIFREP